MLLTNRCFARQAADRGLPAPDAVLFLDLTVEAAAQRGGYGNERYEKQEMQREVGLRHQLPMPHECSSAAEMPRPMRTGQATPCGLTIHQYETRTMLIECRYASSIQSCSSKSQVGGPSMLLDQWRS